MPTLDQNGVEIIDTNAQLQAMYPGNTCTPTANFDFEWLGQTVQFTYGVTQYVETALLNALTAQGAPITTP